MLLGEPDEYKSAINLIKKDIAYKPIELKKTWGEKIIFYLQHLLNAKPIVKVDKRLTMISNNSFFLWKNF